MNTQHKPLVALISMMAIVLVVCIGVIAAHQDPGPKLFCGKPIIEERHFTTATTMNANAGKLEVLACHNVKLHLIVTSDTVVMFNDADSTSINLSNALIGKPIKVINNDATLVCRGFGDYYFTLTRCKSVPDETGYCNNVMILRQSDTLPLILLSEIAQCEKIKKLLEAENN